MLHRPLDARDYQGHQDGGWGFSKALLVVLMRLGGAGDRTRGCTCWAYSLTPRVSH